jgi:hypothetical protein
MSPKVSGKCLKIFGMSRKCPENVPKIDHIIFGICILCPESVQFFVYIKNSGQILDRLNWTNSGHNKFQTNFWTNSGQIPDMKKFWTHSGQINPDKFRTQKIPDKLTWTNSGHEKNSGHIPDNISKEG